MWNAFEWKLQPGDSFTKRFCPDGATSNRKRSLNHLSLPHLPFDAEKNYVMNIIFQKCCNTAQCIETNMLLARTMLVEFCNLYRGYSQERLDYMLLSFPSPSPAVMFENRISLAPAASFSTNSEWDGYKGNSIKNILLGGTFIDESWGPPRVCLSEPLPVWCQKHGRTTNRAFFWDWCTGDNIKNIKYDHCLELG